MIETLALANAALTTLPLTMQIALMAGAPLGRYTIGGRFAGRLPPLWRGFAFIQATLLAAMAGAVLARAGLACLSLTPIFWPAFGLTLLSLAANAASPSRPERLLWTPIIAAMAVTALGVGLLT